MKYVLYLLLCWNGLAFFIMGWDKWRAKTGGFRIPERTLFFFSFVGAGFGVLLGMLCFHHKTRHRSFQIGVPAGILLNFLILWLVIDGILM